MVAQLFLVRCGVRLRDVVCPFSAAWEWGAALVWHGGHGARSCHAVPVPSACPQHSPTGQRASGAHSRGHHQQGLSTDATGGRDLSPHGAPLVGI